MGQAHGREDPPHPGDRRAAARAALLPGRLRGRAHHRSDRDVPRPARRGSHLLQPGAPLRARSRRSACSSGPRPPAARTSPRSATSSSWSRARASMYLGSPRMAEMVIGEKVTLEEMGGAKMHCSVSGCGDVLVQDRGRGDRGRARYLVATCPSLRRAQPARARGRGGRRSRRRTLESVIPADENKPFDMIAVIDGVIDEGSFFEIKKLFAHEIVTGFARIDGRPSASSRTSPSGRAACSSSTRPTRRRASSGCATRSTCRCSTWPTCRAS